MDKVFPQVIPKGKKGIVVLALWYEQGAWP